MRSSPYAAELFSGCRWLERIDARRTKVLRCMALRAVCPCGTRSQGVFRPEDDRPQAIQRRNSIPSSNACASIARLRKVSEEIIRRFASDTVITQAVRRAARAAVLSHKQAGNPIATWQNGAVDLLPRKTSR